MPVFNLDIKILKGTLSINLNGLNEIKKLVGAKYKLKCSNNDEVLKTTDAEGNIVEDRFGKPVPSYSSRQMNRAIKLIDRDLNNEKIENVIRQEEAHAKEASRKKGDAYDILYGKDKRN